MIIFMKNKKSAVLSVTLKTLALCFFAVILTFTTIFACNLLNANRLKNAFQKTAKSVEKKWTVQTSELPIPNLNVTKPFTVNAKTNIAEDKIIDVSASYKPETERMSAQAVFRNSVGDVAGFHAYCTQNRAGISFDDDDNKLFYTLPASEFKKTAGTMLSSVLNKKFDSVNLNEFSKKFLNPLKKSSFNLDKELLLKELLKLYSSVKWDKDTNINLFLKNPVYRFKIQSDDINNFLTAVCKNGLTGYEFADNAVNKWINKITKSAPYGDYSFCVSISEGKITEILCITPEIDGRVYNIKVTVSSDGSNISLLITGDTDSENVLGISVKNHDGEISVSVKCGDSKEFVLSFDTENDNHKLEAGIATGKNVSFRIVSEKEESGYNVDFSVKKNNHEQSINLELLNNYSEFCNAKNRCSLDKANLYELYCLGRDLEKLRSVVGI